MYWKAIRKVNFAKFGVRSHGCPKILHVKRFVCRNSILDRYNILFCNKTLICTRGKWGLQLHAYLLSIVARPFKCLWSITIQYAYIWHVWDCSCGHKQSANSRSIFYQLETMFRIPLKYYQIWEPLSTLPILVHYSKIGGKWAM